MAQIPTVQIKNPNIDGEYIVINKADFDAETHELFEAPAAAPKAAAGPPAQPERPEGYAVEQSGRWYKLIDADGEQIGKAQESEEAAWALMPEAAGESE